MKIEIKLYGGKEIINFDEGRHWFTDKNGNTIISVTGITGILDKPALKFWSVKLTKEYLFNEIEAGKIITTDIIDEAGRQHTLFLKKAADIGTQIHEWCSDWILGKKPSMPTDEKVVNGITAFLKFQKEHKIKWLESERYIYSKKHNFVGILDAVGMMGKDLVLIDFKSSNAIYDEMRFQVAGYQIAYEEETGKKFDKRMIARFGKETGDFEYRELDNDEADKKAFLACLALKRRLKELEYGKPKY